MSLLDEAEIVVKGNASVHVAGFFEPMNDNLPLDGDYDPE